MCGCQLCLLRLFPVCSPTTAGTRRISPPRRPPHSGRATCSRWLTGKHAYTISTALDCRCGLLLDQQLHSLTSSTAAIPLAARFRINSSSTAERQRCMLLSCHRYGLRLGSPAAAPCGSSECIEKDPFKWQVGQAAVLVLKCMKCKRHAAACRGCVSSNSCHTAPAQPLARPACPLWFPSLLHKGSTLLSSCCSNCGRWDDFFKACKGCRVDFMGGLAANAAGG